MAEDYYSLLGVTPDASEEAILQAYRREAAAHHPDVNDDPDAEDTFRRLNRAKAVLTDDARRREYDRLGHEAFLEREASGGSGSRKPADRGPGGSPDGTDRAARAAPTWARVAPFFEPFLGDTVASSGDPTADRHRGMRSGRARHPATVDLRSRLRGLGRVDHADRSTTGTECPKCGGRGAFVHVIDTGRGRHRRIEACERCGGEGTVPG